MKALKIFVILNAVFYILYGLFGVVVPMGMANIMGWTPDLLGMHQLRAVSMVMAVLGGVLWITSRRTTDQKSLTLVIIAVTLGFAVGRILGLIVDGTGPTQTYVEITFEVIWSAIAFILYKRA